MTYVLIFVVIISIVAGMFIYYRFGFDRIKRSRSEVADLLEECLGSPEIPTTDWAYDVLFNIKIKDPELEALRERLEALGEKHPPKPGELMSQELRQEVLRTIASLREQK